ncbi:hypothetical protein PCASD_09536 [Puccinia coronata f. sp. avenae]|uniref:Uncharacterized protein n=1 Tax=Puccinia coronata f. sp. avenae TaxID=200324 RepID=A0A2N5U624_9BASI|nr:hypothetical protein PCASD_09536 [Puccinia coronata f. sp. avenae]
MDLSHDPWTNERLLLIQSSMETVDGLSQRSVTMNQTGHTINSLGEILIIPGEPVLCKTRAREKSYWPARLISCEESSRRGARNQSKKLYGVHFCDGIKMIVPRSFFLTAFQWDFDTAKLGELETTEATFEMILPKLVKEMRNLDRITSGLYPEQSVRDQHEEFLTRTPEGQEQVAENTSYGQYAKATILGVTEHLKERPSQYKSAQTHGN